MLFESAKLYIYAYDRPISRLALDVLDIERFEGPGMLTPQLRLTVAAPPLVPASADILRAAVELCGSRLFEQPYRLLLDSMGLVGPRAAAEVFVLLIGESGLTEEVETIGGAFIAVFDRYQGTFLRDAREWLALHSTSWRSTRDVDSGANRPRSDGSEKTTRCAPHRAAHEPRPK
ncbi:hypothetical protein [Paraburkholderia humisilvae]|uniref:Uncharacterized protein n=2 Tax=Paraburkholderia humisilvae TaxID=627669 RepID=A0A6J5CV54_9BURK|nr:hypothetical protein LMG29542_00054 [Paraburkholderia humisilvae]